MITKTQGGTTIAENPDATTKRPFVEPEISDPVEVLEATAFFQGISGGTDTTGDIV